jgi:WD40 repeat protein
VVIWDTSSGAKLQTILGGNVIGLDYAPDGQVLAASTIPSLDISRYGKPVPFIPPEKRGSGYVSSSTAQYYFGGFWLWDLSDTSSPVDSGEGAEFAVFSPEGKEIVALGYDEQVHVLNVATGERRTFPIGFRDYEFLSAALSPDGSYLALGGAAEAEDDGFIARLDLSGETNFPGFGYGSIFNNGRMKGVTSISVSPDGLYLATGESDGTIRLWGSW